MIDNLITKELLKLACSRTIWDLGNEVLYRLCKEHPDHKSQQAITAKIWLIGRSYAAAIERGKNTKEDGDKFYETKVVPQIQASELDQQLDEVRQFNEINNESIPIILKTHEYLTDRFAKISNKRKRSLASKYLHFHCPSLFFIYDSRAEKGARVLLPKLKVEIPIGNFDNVYAKFFMKLVYLRKEIQRMEGIPLSTREIDKILISYKGEADNEPS